MLLTRVTSSSLAPMEKVPAGIHTMPAGACGVGVAVEEDVALGVGEFIGIAVVVDVGVTPTQNFFD